MWLAFPLCTPRLLWSLLHFHPFQRSTARQPLQLPKPPFVDQNSRWRLRQVPARFRQRKPPAPPRLSRPARSQGGCPNRRPTPAANRRAPQTPGMSISQSPSLLTLGTARRFDFVASAIITISTAPARRPSLQSWTESSLALPRALDTVATADASHDVPVPSTAPTPSTTAVASMLSSLLPGSGSGVAPPVSSQSRGPLWLTTIRPASSLAHHDSVLNPFLSVQAFDSGHHADSPSRNRASPDNDPAQVDLPPFRRPISPRRTRLNMCCRRLSFPIGRNSPAWSPFKDHPLRGPVRGTRLVTFPSSFDASGGEHWTQARSGC